MRFLWVVLACLLIAGCADNAKRTGDDRFSGAYGGISGGASSGVFH